jgi:hypothetical protein
MFNYTYKSTGHYEVNNKDFTLQITREKVIDDCLVLGKTWNVHFISLAAGEDVEFKAFDFKTKKLAEMAVIKFLENN